jgi:hypothetical protein
VHNPTMRARILASVTICAGMMLLALAGCAPQPTPSPTPTPAFASEAEAFAAAEEVYRAYNDALNAKRGGDAEADPTLFLTGLALESDIDAAQYFDQRSLQLLGDGEVVFFHGESASLDAGSITAEVCLDVSATRVMTRDGVDETPVDRMPRVLLTVAFVWSEPELQIANSSLVEGEQC